MVLLNTENLYNLLNIGHLMLCSPYGQRHVNISRQTIDPNDEQRVCGKLKMKVCLRLVMNDYTGRRPV